MRIYVAGVIACVVFLLLAPGLAASEADELRDKGRRAKQEALELKRVGRTEESGKLARKAAELLEAAERMGDRDPRGLEREMDKLHEHLKALRDKERRLKESHGSDEDLAAVRRDALETEQKLARLKAAFERQVRQEERPLPGEPSRDAAARLQEMGRRIEHMRIAAEHLHEAGAHDLAGQLMQKADAIEGEARETKRRLSADQAPCFGPGPAEFRGIIGQIEELRREMDRLRDELDYLRRQIKEM